jgi:hypothetical protein
VVNRQLKVQKLQANGISQRRLSRLCHLAEYAASTNGKTSRKSSRKAGFVKQPQLGAKKGEPIPAKKLAAAAKKPGKLGQRARLAQTLKGFKK